MAYRFLRFPGGKTRAVTLSYDDGVKDDLPLLEIINKYGLKCTFNLNSGLIQQGDPRRLTPDEIRESILATGHEIAVHGAYHIAPASVHPVEGLQDALDCRLWMEQTFGQIIRGMAYPDFGITHVEPGNSVETVQNYLKNIGIMYSRTLLGDNNSFVLPTNWYAWMPTAHHGNPNLFRYAEEFLKFDYNTPNGSWRWPRLFYIWGHSYEYARNGWDRLEEICKTLGGHEDIWYATNIEIYDYVAAYNALQFSADHKKVYNPTVTTVWFDHNRTVYCVKPGELIHID